MRESSDGELVLNETHLMDGRPVRNSSHVRIYEVYIETWFMLTFTLAFVRYICRRNFLRNHSVMSSQKPAVLIDIVSDTI